MKILFFTGKGGVGKSTVAAASAWQISRRARVLIQSLDPAHNLGDIFGVSLGDRKRKISDTLTLQEVDLQKLARDYLERETRVLGETYRYLQVLNLDNYFSILKYSPGIEEYALLTSIERTINEETDFDYLVFDTPPTGLTLRFLALPSVTITWIDRLIAIREKILEKRYTIQKIRRPLKEGEVPREERLKYDPGDDAILQRLRVLKSNYDRLNGILRGEDCTVVLVFNPDMLSLRESQRLVEGLRELGLPLRLMVDNKVTGLNEEMAERVETVMKQTAPGIALERVPLSDGLYCGKETVLYRIMKDMGDRF
ncbi:MAG TPA: ArsA family ATPase [Syntrophales bacterium]|nr:ArsA family ATPase [Syntrophales bacterium]HQN78231.1 ArsA family ATPase [Syntrophales bacterium]HQQ27490.1 ArsA family ATPase [Syntrophales bacterium]